MPNSAQRTINISLIWAAILIILGGALVVPLLFTFEGVNLTVRILVAWAMLVALAMILRSVIIVRELGKGMEWLRTSVLNVLAERSLFPLHVESAEKAAPKGSE